MNHRIWTEAGARVLAMMFLIAGATACGERLSDTTARAPKANEPSPSAVVIGQAPADPAAQPSSETPQTTPPPGARGDLSKAEESVLRPREGDNHSYSTLAPVTPQKSTGVDPQQLPERKTQ